MEDEQVRRPGSVRAATAGQGRFPCPGRSVADREALADVGRLLEFVDGGDRVILPGNVAPLVAGQKLILAQPELAGALARSNRRRGREVGPIEVLFLPQEVEKFAAFGRLGLVGGGKLRRVDELDARRDFDWISMTTSPGAVKSAPDRRQVSVGKPEGAPDPYSAGCPTRIVLDRIGDKWTVLVLGILRDKSMRFN